MYFKEIQLAGFKSFADKIDIVFNEGVTAIVGPNGCGKSNVGDAIRWVLGEQSSKTLRGTSMQDVIFNGTEKRKSLSYCEVSLFFNNADRFFNFEYDDIVITRKLYRSGESEYLINKNVCRLKDIVNLFFDSGIGRDGYSIIGQGKVEEIISSKPETRRLIFEEAAGIAKFKSQKTESERKLEKTEERLTRIRDIVGELERQLGPLKKQAETAKIYLALRDNLKNLEINSFIYQNENVEQEKEKIGIKMDGILQAISLKNAELVSLNQKSNDCLNSIAKVDELIKDLNNQILILTVGMEKQAGEVRLLQERVNNFKTQNAKLEQDKISYETLIQNHKNERQIKEKRKNLLTDRAKEIEKSSGEYAEIVRKFSDLKTQENTLTEQIKAEQKIYNDISSKILVFENRRRMLVEYQQEFEGYAHAVKKLLKESEKNSFIKQQIYGVLASLIKVPENYETAIDVALGASVQNVITENEENAKNLIKFLKENSYGRATFMPISSMKPRYLSVNDRNVLLTNGCIGIASELLQYDKKITNVIQNLLGNVVIVDNLETAVKIAQNTKFSFKIVTLEGDLVNTSGSLTGGSKKSNATNLISREREIETLVKTIKNLQIVYNIKKNSIKDLEEKLEIIKQSLNEIDEKKNSTQLTKAIQITEIKTEINTLNNDFNRINSNILDAETRYNVAKNLIQQNINYINQEESKIHAIFSTAENKETQNKLGEIKKKQDNLEINKIKYQEDMKLINGQKEVIMGEINEANDKKYKVENELEKLNNDLKMLAQRILEEYDLTYETCLPYKKEDFEFAPSITEIYRLKKEINKLGPVNVNAIEDIKLVYDRYDELSTQLADLEQSKSDTMQAISDLESEMSKRFEEKFNQINENFKITFKELFGGGKAHLELVGSENILEAGVDIIAEPPGKKLQNINLLSGGEKALTAIAILFAIIKLRPMPFCLLDEIEAALDDANVERFAQYLKRFAGNTQFIVITHRKPTMELADSLYGVTMEEKGISKVVSVKLSDAIKNVSVGE